MDRRSSASPQITVNHFPNKCRDFSASSAKSGLKKLNWLIARDRVLHDLASARRNAPYHAAAPFLERLYQRHHP